MGVNVPTYFWSVGKGYLLEWAKEVIQDGRGSNLRELL